MRDVGHVRRVARAVGAALVLVAAAGCSGDQIRTLAVEFPDASRTVSGHGEAPVIHRLVLSVDEGTTPVEYCMLASVPEVPSMNRGCTKGTVTEPTLLVATGGLSSKQANIHMAGFAPSDVASVVVEVPGVYRISAEVHRAAGSRPGDPGMWLVSEVVELEPGMSVSELDSLSGRLLDPVVGRGW